MSDKYIYLTSANKILTDDDSPDIIYRFYMLFGLVLSRHDEAQGEGRMTSRPLPQ